jgi:hypothetical protein
MLDHVFFEVVGSFRRAFAAALLEDQVAEQRLAADVLLGDLGWETSYSLPGEGVPPRVRADLAIDWSTWSQSLYRSFLLGEAPDELPELLVELVFRVQRLTEPVARSRLEVILATLPRESPALASVGLERVGPVVEASFTDGLVTREHAVEVTYEGAVPLDAALLANLQQFEAELGAFAGWVASALVRLADLPFAYLPPEPELPLEPS